VGFSRACAPAARALRAPVFLGSLPRQTVRCAPPLPAHCSCAASNYICRTGAAHVTALFLSTGTRRLWNMRSTCPPHRPSQLFRSFRNYFGVKFMYRCHHTPYVFWFIFSIVFGSFLFIILVPFYSPFQFFLFFSSYLFLFFSFRYYSSSSFIF